MNESTCSSKFQTDLRKALPEVEVIKHRDGSMIGCLDASVTGFKKTLWLEYKFIGPTTKGVTAQFMHDGVWHPLKVAEASPTQFAMARRLAVAGHAWYIFWVLDHESLRKRVGYAVLWNPITGNYLKVQPGKLVEWVATFLITPLVAIGNDEGY